MLVLGLHTDSPPRTEARRVVDVLVGLLPRRFPEVVSHLTALREEPGLVELVVFVRHLPEESVAAADRLSACVDEVLHDSSDLVGWERHAPRVPPPRRPSP